jgi:dTDP-4-dehydrorhamnose 3,5-epimerase
MESKVQIEATSIPEVLILKPKKHGDHRGFFSETYNGSELTKCGVVVNFIQDNHSLSDQAGTLRGLHYQAPPFAQDKLVRVIRGAILDIAVDIRRGSPTFGQYVSEIISAEEWNQIFVPKGFAHGFITLQDSTEVIYKVSDHYAPDSDFGVRWDDPQLNIDWTVPHGNITLSEKDRNQPLLNEIEFPFEYEATK